MNTETEIDMNDIELEIYNGENDAELEIYNDENDAELEIYNDENDAEIEINNDIIPSISLTNDVKQLIECLVVEEINHNERQNGFFEELLRLWFGNNVTVRSLIEHKEYEERLIDCKRYICNMIAQYLPDNDDNIYSAYYSLKRDGKYEEHNGDLCTVHYIKDFDMKNFRLYVNNINRKVKYQYNILVKKFEIYLTQKAADEGLLVVQNELKIRIQSQRKAKTTTSYAPFLVKFNATKKKKRPTRIDDFLKAVITTKKAKVSNNILYQHVDEILEEDTDCKLNIDEIINKLETLLVDKIINKKTVQKYIQDRAYIAVDSKESDKVSNNNSSYYEIK